MFKLSKFNPRKVYKKLFLSKKDLKTISDAGHMVGLHSHSHRFNSQNYHCKTNKKVKN